jgi:hypothetical protein
MNIAILVPFYKNVPALTCKCLLDLVIQLRNYGISYSFHSTADTYLHTAREQLFEQFEKQAGKREYDFVLHIDSDQTFRPEDVVRLLKHAEENDFAILSGIYFSEFGEMVLPVLLKKMDEEARKKTAKARGVKPSEVKEKYYRLVSLPNKPFFEVDSCGFGFMACKPSVYQDIVKKFGRPVFKPEVEGSRIKGEDIIWCEKAKKSGHKVMVDHSVIVGHLGGEIGLREYKAWVAEELIKRKTDG